MVDKNGEPLPVYHGSQKFEDDQFKPDVKAVNRNGNVAGYYFTPNPEEASDFAINRKTESYDEGAQVLPVYLIIKNPYEIGVSRVTPDMVNQYRKEMIDLIDYHQILLHHQLVLVYLRITTYHLLVF